MTREEYIESIQKYVCEIEDIHRLKRIFNRVAKEYVWDSGRGEGIKQEAVHEC